MAVAIRAEAIAIDPEAQPVVEPEVEVVVVANQVPAIHVAEKVPSNEDGEMARIMAMKGTHVVYIFPLLT